MTFVCDQREKGSTTRLSARGSLYDPRLCKHWSCDCNKILDRSHVNGKRKERNGATARGDKRQGPCGTSPSLASPSLPLSLQLWASVPSTYRSVFLSPSTTAHSRRLHLIGRTGLRQLSPSKYLLRQQTSGQRIRGSTARNRLPMTGAGSPEAESCARVTLPFS